MDFTKEAEKFLSSDNLVDIQKGLGFAILAQIEVMRANNKTTMNSRKPQEGDVKILSCRRCEKDTQCVLERQFHDEEGLVWKCTSCGKWL